MRVSGTKHRSHMNAPNFVAFLIVFVAHHAREVGTRSSGGGGGHHPGATVQMTDNAAVVTTYKTVHHSPIERPGALEDAIDFYGEIINSDVGSRDLIVTVYWGHTLDGHWFLIPLGMSHHRHTKKDDEEEKASSDDANAEHNKQQHHHTKKKKYEFKLKRRLLKARHVPVADHSSNLCIQVTGPTIESSGMFCVENPLTRRIFYVHMEIDFDVHKPKKQHHEELAAPMEHAQPPPPPKTWFAPNRGETIAIKGHILPVDPDAQYNVYLGFDPTDHSDYVFKETAWFSEKTGEKSAYMFSVTAPTANEAADRLHAVGKNPELCIWIEKKGVEKPCLQRIDNFFGTRLLSRRVDINLHKLECAVWMFPKPPEPTGNVMVSIKGSIKPPSPDYNVVLGFESHPTLHEAPIAMRTSGDKSAFMFLVKAKEVGEMLKIWVQKTDVKTEKCHFTFKTADVKHDGNKRMLGEIDLATNPGCVPLLPPPPPPSKTPEELANEAEEEAVLKAAEEVAKES